VLFCPVTALSTGYPPQFTVFPPLFGKKRSDFGYDPYRVGISAKNRLWKKEK
jgi:hypothetical protein